MRITLENAPRFGGQPVHPDIVVSLNAAVRDAPAQWAKVKTLGLVSQGWGSSVKASNGTHSTGHAVDILTSRLANDEIRALCASLNRHDFAAAFRPAGYPLTPTSRNKTEHIHAAYRGKSNYWAVWRAIQPGGNAHIDKVLKGRKP